MKPKPTRWVALGSAPRGGWCTVLFELAPDLVHLNTYLGAVHTFAVRLDPASARALLAAAHEGTPTEVVSADPAHHGRRLRLRIEGASRILSVAITGDELDAIFATKETVNDLLDTLGAATARLPQHPAGAHQVDAG